MSRVLGTLVFAAVLVGGWWAWSPGQTAETGYVKRLVDGDTIVLTDDRRVRVLVMDSCEMSTPGGTRALTAAQALLPPGTLIVLTRGPRAAEDRWQRLLRYVELPDHRDFAETMVAAPHTGVYQGRHDADEARVTRARQLDADGRVCS